MTRLELVWPNKERFLLVPKDEEGRPVWVDRDHPAAAEVRVSDFSASVGEVNDDDPYSDNLLFTGDSLDVLRILAEVPEYRRVYRGKVRQVYIDPPFNTGQAFEHYDDWLEHATWLSFMRERLLLIRDLLAPDGSVWVHLDDAEQHRMRMLLDDVFGADRFVGTIVWQKRYSRDNRPAIGPVHDYVTVYAPSGARWKEIRNKVPRAAAKEYRNPNHDPRGPWRPIPLDVQGGHATASQFYDVTLPSGRVVRPKNGRAWAVTKTVLSDMIARGEVYFGRKGDGMPNTIRYLADDAGLTPWTWWPHSEAGHNDEAKKEVVALFGEDAVFATPKPERLIELILHIGSNPGDIVLDCFAGSGTTGAVAHKMGRHWVTAEVSTDTVEGFTRPRLELVVKGEDPGGITEKLGWEGGRGFRSVEVGPSMYVDVPGVGVLLSDEATNGLFAKAVAGQLGYEFQPDASPLCGVRGRMRLAVLDGAVGPEEVRAIVATLGEGERVEIVGRAVLDESQALLTSLAKGSKFTKAPRDLLTKSALRTRRRAQRETGE
ncbi:MAG TPA: site-specific DNA-methyltransferase [Nocardioidaceae bacterium]|nr:site-specific DNA-methyltransferase [Nocardioidaceae bacterium]